MGVIRDKGSWEMVYQFPRPKIPRPTRFPFALSRALESHRDATDPPHSRPHPSQLLFELTPQLDPTGRQGRSERESRTAEDHRSAARKVGHRHRLHPHITELP